MGEAKRKRRLQAREWVLLFDGSSAAVALSRPEHRPESTRTQQRDFCAGVARRALTDKTALCFDEACHNELIPPHVEVFAFVKTTADGPMICMGICPECAKKSDAELIAVIRSEPTFRSLDPKRPAKAKRVRLGEVLIAYQGDGIVLANDDDVDLDTGRAWAMNFERMLRDGELPRFAALRQGSGNCHTIVNQLYLDFKALGIAKLFAYRRGSSAILKADHDPDGLHSWIEVDGFAIDGSNGGEGLPILVQAVESYYRQRQLTGIRDIEIGA
jgi:hypothetical protein